MIPKTRSLLLVALLCAPCIGLAQSTSPAPAQTAAVPAQPNPPVNYMPNPGFEVVNKDGWPEGGYYKFNDPTSTRLELDDKVKHSGKYSLHIIYDPKSPDKAGRYSGVINPVGGMFRPGTTFTYSAYVKTKDISGTVWLEAYQYPAPFGEYTHRSQQQVPSTTNWMRISLTFKVRPDISDVQFRCMVHSGDFKGELWFDDLKLEEGPTPTDFVETWESEFYLLGEKPSAFNVPYDYEVNAEVATCCVAPSRSPGAAKMPVLFVMQWRQLREPVELLERADIATATVAINNVQKIHENCILRMREQLQRNPKVLVMQPGVWDGLLAVDRDGIEKRVRGGMGLLFYNSGNPSEKMKALFAKGVPYAGLPPDLPITAWQLEKGMIVMNYGRAGANNTFCRELSYDHGVRSLWLAAQKPFGELKLTMDPLVPATGQPWKLKAEVVRSPGGDPAEIQVRVRPTVAADPDILPFIPAPVLQERAAACGGVLGGIEMGGLPAGQYFIEAVAVDGNKKPVAWQFMPFVTDGPVRIWSATAEEPSLKPEKDLKWRLKKATSVIRGIPSESEGLPELGQVSQKLPNSPIPRFFALLKMAKKIVFQQPLKVNILLENNSSAEQAVTLRSALYDTNERLLMQLEPLAIKLPAGRTEKTITVCASHSTTPMAELRIELENKQGKLDQQRLPLCAEPVLPEPDFRLAIYASFYRGSYNIGADTFVDSSRPELGCRAYPWYGYMPRPGSDRQLLKKDDFLTDPEVAARIGKMLADNLRAMLPYRTVAVILEDEWAHNFTPCPQNLAAFKKYLKESYGKIEALNQSWGTNLRSFDEVTFDPCSEAAIRDKKAGPVPWADLQSAMERALYEYLAALQKAAAAVDPNVRLGLSGTWDPTANNGLDWWLLMKVFRSMGTYGGIHTCLEESFQQPGTRLFQWSYPTENSVGRARHDPWRDVLRQRDGYLHFGSGFCPLFLPDYRPHPAAVTIGQEVEAIRRGPARLLKESSREYFGIAVLFSMPSYHAAGIPGQSVSLSINDEMYSLERVLSDTRLDLKFVSYEQLAKGQVTSKKFKVLFLPYSQALSAAEVKAVRAFATSGGVVIADLRPATYDEHCKKLATGALDDLFGIGPLHGGNALTAATLKPGADLGPLPEAGVRLGESNLVSAGAKSLAQLVYKETITPGASPGKPATTEKTAPAVLVRAVGKGKAILLNFAFPDYCKYLAGGTGGEISIEKQAKEAAAVRNLIAKVLEKEAGVVPAARLLAADGTEMRGTRLYTYRDGAATYIGINPEYSWVEGEKPFINAKLLLAKPGELYDSRDGKYLGRTDNADIKLKETYIKIFAVLPYRVEGLQLSAPGEVCVGKSIKVRGTIRTSGGDPGRHFLVARLQRPDGTERRWDRVTWDAPRGTGEVAIPLALNDPPGNWKLLIQDVATGVHAEATIRVKARE